MFISPYLKHFFRVLNKSTIFFFLSSASCRFLQFQGLIATKEQKKQENKKSQICYYENMEKMSKQNTKTTLQKKDVSHDTSYDISDYLDMQEDEYIFSKKKFFTRIILSIALSILASAIIIIAASPIVSIVSIIVSTILLILIILWPPIEKIVPNNNSYKNIL